jgi:hypothetical protein
MAEVFWDSKSFVFRIHKKYFIQKNERLFKNEVGIISEGLKRLNFNGIYLRPQSLN